MMERATEAVARLRDAGFNEDLRIVDDRVCTSAGAPLGRLDELTVDEIVRFEGRSDPGDQSILLAVRNPRTDVRGLLLTPYGPVAGASEAEVIEGLCRGRADHARAT